LKLSDVHTLPPGDAAYMLLATANAQGELSALEVGMHALHCVEKGKHGAVAFDRWRAQNDIKSTELLTDRP